MKTWIGMFVAAGFVSGIAFISKAPTAHGGGPAAGPVIVELFSSEGCSSCPSADKVLSRLDRTQPVGGADVLALEFHVDYWNDLGWTDPFSSEKYSARQRDYATVISRGRVYTPQMVVDGQTEFVGSSEAEAREAIGSAAQTKKARVLVSRKGNGVAISVSDLADAGGSDPAEVWLALTESGLSTRVLRGENGGRTLEHAPVVRELRSLGVAKGASFLAEQEVKLMPSWKAQNVRAVVFVQHRRSKRIVGAGSVKLQ